MTREYGCHFGVILLVFLYPQVGISVEATRPGTVDLHRDDWGMPHIYAASETDGYFGLGYATAEDRMVQTLFSYLLVRGELAKHFGAGPIEELAGVHMIPPRSPLIVSPVDSDREVLRGRYLVDARRNLAQLSPELRANLRSFVAGFNAYLATHPERLPDWAPPLEPALPLALFAYALFGTNPSTCLSKVHTAAAARAGRARSPLTGSNAWVVSGARSKDRGVVFSSDSHGAISGLAGPVFYLWRMHTPTLDVFVVDLSGTVSMIKGHSQHYGWGWTEGPRLTADCYAVETLESDTNRYRVDGVERSMAVVPYRIEIKDGDAEAGEFHYTRHNGVYSPVVHRAGRVAYAVSSAYAGRAGFVSEQMYRLASARNRADLDSALETRDWYPANLLLGGADGTLLYARPGRIPKRADGVDPREIIDGNTSRTLWLGIHPWSDLVKLWNPDEAYLTNANVSPDMLFPEPRSIADRLTADRFPDYFWFETGQTNTRQRRSIALLEKARRIDDAGAAAIVTDVRIPDTEKWGPVIALAAEASGVSRNIGDDELLAFFRELSAFDGVFEADSRAALYHVWLRRGLVRDAGAAGDALAEAIDTEKPLSAGEQALLVEAVHRAYADLVNACGSAKLSFGDVYRIGGGKQDYPASGISFAARTQSPHYYPQMASSLLAARYAPDENGCHAQMVAGTRAPFVVHFGARLRSYSAFMSRTSEKAASGRSPDQSRLLSERRLRSNRFEADELAAHLSATKTLEVVAGNND